MEHATESALTVMRTVLQVGAVLSLLMGMAPMIWGQVKVKWIVTALMSCIMFGVMSLIISMFVGLEAEDEPVATAERAAPAVEIDWRLTGIVALSVLTCALLSMAGVWVAKRHFAGRRRAAERRRQMADAADPALVARALVPDMYEEVDLALSRIVRLRTLGARIGNQEDADSLALVNGRLPELMERYRVAAEASTHDEAVELARTALRSVVEIGRVAEDARLRIAITLGDELRTESRYIEMRSGAAAGEFRADI